MVFPTLFLVLLISIFSVAEQHSAGAPEAACSGMIPGHGLNPQPNDDSIPTSCTINTGNYKYIYIKANLSNNTINVLRLRPNNTEI